MQRAQVEEEFIHENLLVNDPLRQVRTVPMSETTAAVKFNEAFELKKYEIEINARERGNTDRHRITVDADVQKHATQSKEETERLATQMKEETERVARVAEAKAKEAEAKLNSRREREITLRMEQDVKLARADPAARKAEADADALEARARIAEAETNKIREQIKLAEAEITRKKRNMLPVHRPKNPKRNKVKESLDEENEDEDKENVVVNAYIPRTFAPPKYSETYNRPRRGVLDRS